MISRYSNPLYWSSAIAITSFLTLFFTGILLAFWYYPSPEKAYKSIEFISTYVYFGRVLLSLHHWATHFLIISTIIHMLRVYFMREKKVKKIWNFGAYLLILSVFFVYTGYLLRWDNIGYWSIEVTSSLIGYIPVVGEFLKKFILGGSNITSLSLIRFYFMHIAFLPLLSICFIIYHYYSVRKKTLTWEEIGVGMLTIGVLLCLSVIQPFHLSSEVSYELGIHVKPFWLFLWLYTLERLIGMINPSLNFIAPLSLIGMAIFIYFMPLVKKKTGIALLVIILILSIIGAIW